MADVRTSALTVLDLVKKRKLERMSSSSSTARKINTSNHDDRLGDEREWRGFRERGYERSLSSRRG